MSSELHNVPPSVQSWLNAQLDNDILAMAGPQVAVVLAVQRAASVPDDVLRWWSWMIDDDRRQLDQSERELIEQARAAGWTDEEIERAILLDETESLDARLAQLNTRVYRVERPPVPCAVSGDA